MVPAVRPWKLPLEDDHIRAAGGMAGQLDRSLDGFRPGIGEEKAINPWRDDRAQLRYQLQQGLMHDEVDLAVQQAGCLLADGLHNARVAMASVCHPDAAGEVQVFASIQVIDIRALGALGDDRCVVSPDGERCA